MIRKFSVLFFCFLLPSVVFTQGVWMQKANNPQVLGSAWGCSFSIGNKGYAVITCDLSIGCAVLYEYDPGLDAWTQKANAPYLAKFGPAGFAIGSKGYICGGNQTISNILYEYDPVSNAWTQKTNLPIEIKATVGFSIGNKGYVVGGQSNPNFTNTVWEYNPSSNTWAQKASFPIGTRAYAVGFSIGNKGYFGTGRPQSGPPNMYNDFWQYNPSSNTWLQKANFPGVPRILAAGFSVGGKGYIGTGHDSLSGPSGMRNDFWVYDTLTDTWSPITTFPTPREYAVGFSIGNNGYVVGGVDSTSTSFQSLRDLWEYCDTCTVGINELSSTMSISTFPNPFSGIFTIAGKGDLIIYNILGEKIFSERINSSKSEINLINHPNGIYFLQAKSENGITVKKIIKE